MLTKEQKDFLDTLARSIAWESLDNTGKGDYRSFIEYIVYEADYEDIMLTVFDKQYLTEQDKRYGMKGNRFAYTDVERARRLSAIENALAPLIGTGVAMFASGSVDKKVLKPAIKMLGGHKNEKGELNLFGKGLKGIGGMLLYTVLSTSAKLLVKFLAISLEKSKSVCRHICKKHFDKNSPYYKYEVEACTSRCKIQGLEDIIRKLRTEVQKCKQTPNPEKCQQNLVKMIARYNDMLKEEKAKYIKNTKKLKNIKSS